MTCALKDKAFRLLLVSEKMDAKDLFMKTAFGQSACVWNKKNKTKRQTQVGFEIMLLGKIASLFFSSKTLFCFVFATYKLQSKYQNCTLKTYIERERDERFSVCWLTPQNDCISWVGPG